MSRDYITGLCALQTKLAEMEGCRFQKKRKRYSDMATTVLDFYCGTDDRFWVGEVVLSASDDEVHATGYKDLKDMNAAYSWVLK